MKADDLIMLDIGTISGDSVDEMNAGGIRGVAIGNKSDLLIGLSSSDSFLHGDYSRQGVSVVCDVIGSDFKTFGRDKKEDVIMLAHDFDISFITGAYRVYIAFIFQIKGMAVESGGRSIIQDSLIRDIDVKDRAEDEGGFSGSDSE